jgi:hypothetical protein
MSTEQPIQPEVVDDFEFELAADVIKTGVDRLISATKRGNSKQIATQVGQVSRDLIALSKACLAEVEILPSRIIEP